MSRCEPLCGIGSRRRLFNKRQRAATLVFADLARRSGGSNHIRRPAKGRCLPRSRGWICLASFGICWEKFGRSLDKLGSGWIFLDFLGHGHSNSNDLHKGRKAGQSDLLVSSFHRRRSPRWHGPPWRFRVARRLIMICSRGACPSSSRRAKGFRNSTAWLRSRATPPRGEPAAGSSEAADGAAGAHVSSFSRSDRSAAITSEGSDDDVTVSPNR